MRRRTTIMRVGSALAAASLIIIGSAGPGHTEPSPTPGPGPSTAVPDVTPTPTPTPTPEPTPGASTPAASTPAPTPADRPAAKAAAEPQLTLTVTPTGGSPGRFYEDIGAYAFRGTGTDLAEGSTVEIYRRTASVDWARVATSTLTAGAYAASLPVQAVGTFTFVATTGGAPGSGDEVSSTPVTVTVADSRIILNPPVRRIDSLRNLEGDRLGRAGPGRGDGPRRGAEEGQVRAGQDRGHRLGRPILGRVGYGRRNLATYTLRAIYKAPNRNRWEKSTQRKFSRIAVLNAVVTKTTKDEVAKTYHSGCPVGPSKLRTVTMNFYGRDKKMHRGVLIVRSDLTPEIIRGFTRALDHRFPVAKMYNPNRYGGNDPRQMKANNSSGFNCRKVVGNPYRQSPHSYGIAIDVNPVQNPYRDVKGKWWPSNGKSYIDRTPRRFGMLTKKSHLTKSLRGDDFFWGGFWKPGRDYQHFEYRP